MGKSTGRRDGIRVGQVVKVVNPAFFVRCGYPMTFKEETKRIETEHERRIVDFFRESGIPLTILPGEWTHRAVRRVAEAMAYESCKQKGWGGRERTIHTHRIEAHAGVEFTVQAVRFVKTGVYEPMVTCWTDDGWEPEPAYLGNERTHRILRTTIIDSLPGSLYPDTLEIEAANCEAVE